MCYRKREIVVAYLEDGEKMLPTFSHVSVKFVLCLPANFVVRRG